MQLTSILLYRDLKEQFDIADARLLSPEQPVARPLFCEEGRSAEGNHVRVTDRLPDFSGLQADVLFVVCPREDDGEAKTLPEGHFSAILLSGGAPLFRVFNCIQSVFDRYEDWEARLFAVCRNDGSPEELLEASLPVFGNPICIIGQDRLPVAAAGFAELPEIQEIFENSALCIRYANAFNQDAACQIQPAQREPVLFPDHITGHRSLNINLFAEGQAEYRLSVVENRVPLSDADRYLITRLARHAEYVLQRMQAESSSRNSVLRSAFQVILTDRNADAGGLSRQLSAAGWLPEHRYFCAVFRASGSGRGALNPRAVCRYVRDTFPFSCSLVLQEESVSFFNLTASGADPDDVCGELAGFIRDSILKAGYSRAMEGHANLYRQYLQAQIALQLGARLHPQLWIHRFNHVALPFLLREAVGTLPASMVCHEKLLRLREADLQQGTEYIKTLKVYLDHNLNTVQSARSLYIHRSTFLYRLERIKRILEMDLEDPEELFYLNLSLRLPEEP